MPKLTRRLFTATLALAASPLVLGLTLAPAAAEPRAEVIHWWTSGGESAALKVFAEAYTKAGGTWIDSAVAGGENARSAAINRIVGGNPPTAMQFNTSRQFDDIVAQGLVNDVDDVAAEEKWAEVLPPAFIEAVTREGHIYAIPVNVHGQNWMWASTAAFEKAGVAVPETWDDFFPALDALKAAGIVPLALGGQPWQEGVLFNSILLGKGGRDLYLSVYGEGGEEAVRSDAFREVAEIFGKLRDYVDPGMPGRNWNDATAMLINGTAGVQFMGDWVKGEFTAAGFTAGKEYQCVAGLGENGYMIGGDVFVLARTDDPAQREAQRLFAKTLLDPVVQVDFNALKGSIPVRSDVDASRLDACGQKGFAAMQDTANQVPVVDMLATPDLVGATRDAFTAFFHDKNMPVDAFVDAVALALEQAG